MRIDKPIFVESVESIAQAGGGSCGPASPETLMSLAQWDLPIELIDLFMTHAPKSEIWAGAGTIFSETDIVQWNNDLPEGRDSGLFIIGSAPNGDHIVVDLDSGTTGYLSHEHDLKSVNPPDFYVPVSPSVGRFVRDINTDPPALPEDYWEAKRGQ